MAICLIAENLKTKIMEIEKNEKDKLINSIVSRIKTEREKHPEIEWEIIASHKIYDTLITYWQGKMRWKSLENEPPKFEGNKYYILVRNSPQIYDIACIMGAESVALWIAIGYKEWKEIEL